MSANVYEGMFILDAGRYARDASGTAKVVEDLIRGHDGEILVSRLWEERRLAYPIKGQRKGVYWLTYFKMEGGQLQSINRQTQISDGILRHLILKLHPKLVETIVSHAAGRHEEAGPSADNQTPSAKPTASSRPELAAAAEGS